MRRAIRLALLVALALFALPLTVSADAPATETPDGAQPDAQSEISIEELESLLGITAPQETSCGLHNDCQTCTTTWGACACNCDLTQYNCEQGCNGNQACRFACIQEGKACQDCCFSH